ncbi:PAS domain-containing protein [Denitrobaculum tricleocarpae]|uniref:PAS domain-containing protein n=1 Tax=Denitrobaculum tricleocarpae TaxID=2591009 RepID=A0A545TUK5_9PROT|nr:PAS domain-containing protein [Denitrobaculum tricleocarpae]TQV80889.1 PAS domain-containing protein [Denitrobaculum tricleocarpae]
MTQSHAISSCYVEPEVLSHGGYQITDDGTEAGTETSWCLLSDSYERETNAAPPALRPQFVRIYRYLQSVAPPGHLPGRQHIDPLDFHELLTYVNLVNVEQEDGQARFRFRLVGTTQTIMAKRDISGLLVEDAVLPYFAARILGNLRRVLETGTPLYDRFSMPHPNREFIDSERVYYPLAGNGETIDMIFILNGYYGASGLDPFDKKK